MDLSNDTIIRAIITVISLGATYLISLMVIKVLRLKNELIEYIRLTKKDIIEYIDKEIEQLKKDNRDHLDREIEHIKDLIKRNGYK